MNFSLNGYDFLQIFLSLAAITIPAPFLGRYFAEVYRGEPHLFQRPFGWLERLIQRFIGPESFDREMNWREYAKVLLLFSFFGLLFVFLLQITQHSLPLNPQGLPNVSWHSALNTSISFMTNTNWQGYAGETTMSYLVQMVGLTVQNFVSAATGMAVAVALGRAIGRKNSETIGNFWSDLSKSVIYILLPFSLLFSVVLVSEGVIQNFNPAETITTLEGNTQVIPMGPAASQIAIKQLGTNGGGFFNANSAHPYENPTPFSNWLQLIAILLIPAGFAFLWGHLVGQPKQGRVLFVVMLTLLVGGLGLSLWAEVQTNAHTISGLALEGKETRIGVTNSILWSTFTTAASNGSVNAMHGSLSPVAGAVALFNMMLGEIIFGGVGAGLYGMILFVLLTVFIAGLMVGRTPEYLGKKIESREVQMTVFGIMLPNAAVLIGAGISAVLPIAIASLTNKGPRGLSEILYAFTSAANNNGSAFAGLNANTVYYNLALGLAMLVGRFGVILPILAIAGSLAKKKTSPQSFGTFTTDNSLFAILLIGVILIVGGLTYFPALALGPIVEHFLVQAGRTF
jgi:potassium-transporting ATPase potassium-binding subunit